MCCISYMLYMTQHLAVKQFNLNLAINDFSTLRVYIMGTSLFIKKYNIWLFGWHEMYP